MLCIQNTPIKNPFLYKQMDFHSQIYKYCHDKSNAFVTILPGS